MKKFKPGDRVWVRKADMMNVAISSNSSVPIEVEVVHESKNSKKLVLKIPGSKTSTIVFSDYVWASRAEVETFIDDVEISPGDLVYYFAGRRLGHQGQVGLVSRTTPTLAFVIDTVTGKEKRCYKHSVMAI